MKLGTLMFYDRSYFAFSRALVLSFSLGTQAFSHFMGLCVRINMQVFPSLSWISSPRTIIQSHTHAYKGECLGYGANLELCECC
jgi:hypothetical protein